MRGNRTRQLVNITHDHNGKILYKVSPENPTANLLPAAQRWLHKCTANQVNTFHDRVEFHRRELRAQKG